MNFYIAGKWEENKLINGYAERLIAVGYTLTCSWMTRHLGDTPLDVAAIEDLAGVRDADFCVFVFERELAYSGAMSELGIALALHKRVFVIGSGGNRNVFTHHPMVEHVNTFDELLEKLEHQSPTPATPAASSRSVVPKESGRH